MDEQALDTSRESRDPKGVVPLLFRKREFVLESPYRGTTTSCEETGKPTLDFGPDD
jgi:hypothetical protein